MRIKYPDQLWNRKDIENEGICVCDEAFEGYMPTQAFIRIFREHGIKHFIRQADGYIIGFIWTYL